MKEKGTAIKLKLILKHPRASFRLGMHKITKQLKEYNFSDAEVKELKGKGPAYWLRTEEQLEKAKKAKKK